MPDFTVHDISHTDSLWAVASLVVGDEYTINPAEAYVLGGAFLLHDAGLSLSAYQGGLDEIQSYPIWRDSVAQLYEQRFGRSPTEEEMGKPEAGIRTEALGECVRSLHAQKASTLAETEYSDTKDKTAYFLIEDTDLRSTYAQLIGRIAYSHWWKISDLADRLEQVQGAMPGFRPEWTVDPLKLACVLRVADACHIDARRAPGFLRALRKPEGFSALHWRFQERILSPIAENGRVLFTSSKPFTVDDAEAWWVGYDLVSVADKELRETDSLLADAGRERFSLKGIVGSSNPRQLAKLIATDGWTPVDTQLRVNQGNRQVGVDLVDRMRMSLRSPYTFTGGDPDGSGSRRELARPFVASS